ncbi:hypothetical protein Patl1_28684 [Pistacia atlantica]|uniref:Uncharacterized protein n=1 Tax=Pistacia atlantica TaxID=434234 RepID=A0ACC1BDJ3_9ROSI|nr:hypothetical protein Patl1_28684 [Pistacia atlantica]
MIYISLSPKVQAQVDEANLKLMTETIEWPLSMPYVYEESWDENEEEDSLADDEERHTMKYYISYGALAANRIPCPPRSGRSYYTHNCYKARGPAHPYTRGCSSITRCRR